MRAANLVVMIAFGILVFFAIVTAVSMDRPDGMMHGEFVIRWIPQAIGIFIASIAALAQLLKCLSGANLEQLCPFVLPLFAGLLLINVHWSSTIAVGMIVLAIVTKHAIVAFSRLTHKGEDTPES